jgi:hypothetical protein
MNRKTGMFATVIRRARRLPWTYAHLLAASSTKAARRDFRTGLAYENEVDLANRLALP